MKPILKQEAETAQKEAQKAWAEYSQACIAQNSEEVRV